MNKVYLGDGVYAYHDGYQLWLETTDGISTTNRIALEDSVFDNLIKYRQSLQKGEASEDQTTVRDS